MRNSPETGESNRRASSTAVGIRAGIGPQRRHQLGVLDEAEEHESDEAGRRLVAGHEQLVAEVSYLATGEDALALGQHQPAAHVGRDDGAERIDVRRHVGRVERAGPLLDLRLDAVRDGVAGLLVGVQVAAGQRGHRSQAPVVEVVAVFLTDAQQLADDDGRERRRVELDEVALAGGQDRDRAARRPAR